MTSTPNRTTGQITRDRLSVKDEMIWGTPGFLLGIAVAATYLMVMGFSTSNNLFLAATSAGLIFCAVFMAKRNNRHFATEENGIRGRFVMLSEPVLLGAIVAFIAAGWVNALNGEYLESTLLLAVLVPTEMFLIITSATRWVVKRTS